MVDCGCSGLAGSPPPCNPVTATDPCDDCAGGTLCMMTIPFFGAPPFTNQALAQAYLDNFVSNCIAGLLDNETAGATPVATFTSNQFAISADSATPSGFIVLVLVPVFLLAGTRITIGYNLNSTGGSYDEAFEEMRLSIYKLSDFSLIGSEFTLNNGAPGFLNGSKLMPIAYSGFPPVEQPMNIPADDCYVVRLRYQSGYIATVSSIDTDWTIACAFAMQSGGIRAAYGTPGSPDYLVCTP